MQPSDSVSRRRDSLRRLCERTVHGGGIDVRAALPDRLECAVQLDWSKSRRRVLRVW
jgi:hypothetical protein